MRHLLLIPLLAPALAAQSQTFVSPHSHHATWEGDLSLPIPFSLPTTNTPYRLQQIDAGQTGAVRVLAKLSFRRNASSPHLGLAANKTITMKLVLADAVALAGATATFAANYAAAGATVFSGPLSTPPQWLTTTSKSPSDFDFAIPFTAAWPYLGTQPFLWDVDVSAVSTTERSTLDAASSGFPLFAYSAYEMYGKSCKVGTGPMELRSYGQTLGAPMQAITWGIDTTNAPANAAAVWLIGAQKIAQPIPGLCTDLYTLPLVSVSGTTDAAGAWKTYFQTPQNPSYFGFPLPMQTVVADPAQSPLPFSASNGLVYRAAPMGPTFQAGYVYAATGQAAGSSFLTGRAVVVQFN